MWFNTCLLHVQKYQNRYIGKSVTIFGYNHLSIVDYIELIIVKCTVNEEAKKEHSI